MRRSNLFWGIIVVLAGSFLLLEQLGILTFSIWGIFWPTVLILFGVWVILGVRWREADFEGQADSVPMETAQSASVQFHHAAGRIFVEAGTPAGDLLSGTFAGGLNKKVNRRGDQLDVELHAQAGFPLVIGPWNWGGRGLDWRVKLTPEIPLALEFHTGASESRLDLSALNVTNLRLETGASSTTITTPARCEHTSAKVSCGAASVHIKVPEGVAARIRFSGALMDFSVDRARFPKGGGYYQSPDYETAPYKIEMNLEGGVGAIRVS